MLRKRKLKAAQQQHRRWKARQRGEKLTTTIKSAAKVKAAQVARRVRADVFERDIACRYCRGSRETFGHPDQWHHFPKRSKTRGMAAERRHTTKGSVRACFLCHRDLEAGFLKTVFESESGFDGPIRGEWR